MNDELLTGNTEESEAEATYTARVKQNGAKWWTKNLPFSQQGRKKGNSNITNSDSDNGESTNLYSNTGFAAHCSLATCTKSLLKSNKHEQCAPSSMHQMEWGFE